MAASARDLDLRQHHGVETPEHVEVQFELAGVGSRMAAGLLDVLFLVLALLVVVIGGGAIGDMLAFGSLARCSPSAVMILLSFWFGLWYFTLFEALHGRPALRH